MQALSQSFFSKKAPSHRYTHQIKQVSILEELKLASQQSLRYLNLAEIDRIHLLRTTREQKVYGVETGTVNTYFHTLLDNQISSHVLSAVKNELISRQHKVQKELDEGRLTVVTQRTVMDRQAELLATKISRANAEMSEILEPSEMRINSSRGHSTDIEGIRSFLKSIHERKKERKQRVEKSYEMESLSKNKIILEEQQTSKLRHRERVDQQRARNEQRKRKLEVEREQLISKEEEFKQFIDKLHINTDKPLFKQKEEEAVQREILEKHRLELRIQELKGRWKPIDGQEIKKHEKDYESRRDEMMKRRLEKSTEQSQTPVIDNLFRGQHHKLLKADDRSGFEEREKAKSVRDRLNQFGEEVREHHRPKVDEVKRLEMKNLIDKETEKLNQKEDSPNPRALGNQYLRQLKRLTPEIRSSFSQAHSPRTPSITPVPKSSRIKDYLYEGTKNLKRTMSPWKKILSSDQLSSSQKYSSIISRTEQLDKEARRKEGQLRVSQKNTTKALELKDSIDKHYLSSIHAKLELMSKVLH